VPALCSSGKVGHDTMARAWAQVDQLRERNRENREDIDWSLVPFLCDECRRWHVGHTHASLTGRLREHFTGRRLWRRGT